jgi:hypothetical protein
LTTSQTPKFRKEALDFLHSPNELAQPIQVVSKKGWITLATLYGILISLLTWGFLGTIPTRITAKGILSVEKNNPTTLTALVFLPALNGRGVQTNKPALIALKALETTEHGSIKGAVTNVSPLPQDKSNTLLLKEAHEQGIKLAEDAILIRIRLEENKNTQTGYQWTTNQEPEIKIVPGMPIEATITLKEQSPISLIIPSLKKLFRERPCLAVKK